MIIPPPPAAIYILGPMTDIEDLNREAFEEAEALLAAAGYLVTNPRKGLTVEMQRQQQLEGMSPTEQRQGEPYRQGMRRNTRWIVGDTVTDSPYGGMRGAVALPGWEKASGARYDRLVCQMIGIPVAQWPSFDQEAPEVRTVLAPGDVRVTRPDFKTKMRSGERNREGWASGVER